MQRFTYLYRKLLWRGRLLTLLLGILVAVTGCGTPPPKAPGPAVKKTRIGLMITPQGLNDLGFNDLAHLGLKNSEKKHTLESVIIEPSTMKDPEASLRFFAGQKFDAIIAVGAAFLDAIKNVSREYPDLRFFVIDSAIDEPNIRGISFREDEGSFLCGFIAARVSKTAKIGFIGGLKNEIIMRFADGFRRGAAYAASETQVIDRFIAEDFSGFNRPAIAKTIALDLYREGCDVIYHAAGASGLGVISAGVEAKKFVIGVDMDQDSTAPGLVLTSMLKRVDLVVEDVIRMVVENKGPEWIKKNYGLNDGGVDLTNFRFTRAILGDALINEVTRLREQISTGKLSTSTEAEQP
jgi:basic membrane protein A